jgi:hypothetical protein
MSCELDKSPSPPCRATGPEVKLAAEAADPDRDTLLYTYTAAAGRLTADGPGATLDLTGVAPGTYTVTVEVDDGNGGVAKDSKELEVAYCPCDPPPPPLPCPTVTVSCPDTPGSDGRLVFTANVAGGDPNVTPTFNWTASAGTITSGQGTSSIIVDAQGLSYGSFTATVEVAGYDRSCRTSSSCTILIEPPIQPRKIDEYGDIPHGDERQRLDNITVELRNDPGAQLYLICYAGRRGGLTAAARRCRGAKGYFNSRGIEPGRVVTLDGGRRERPAVEAWFVPFGAAPPRPSPAASTRARGRR